MAELIIYSGKLKGQRLLLPEREVIVGRDEDCHMRIASSLVSRKHCTLKGSAAGVLVRDLESQNGTYVNDVAITEPFLMKPGDILRVGASLFQVPRIRTAAAHDDSSLSDDDISTWLSDDRPTESGAAPDTTIIKGRAVAPAATVPQTTGSTSHPTAQSESRISGEGRKSSDSHTVPTIRQPPKSVKEQAAEIIKRHWEIVRAKNAE